MGEQLSLGEDFHPTEKISVAGFRPIHYLGSKLRLVDAIKNTVDKVDPSKGRLCDLFSGSGVVSSIFAADRCVTSVDVQEYSRVLCSAILNPAPLDHSDALSIATDISNSSLIQRLCWAFRPLLNHEQESLAEAIDGNIDPLAEILESGPLIACFNNREIDRSEKYKNATLETIKRFKNENLVSSPDSITSRYYGGIFFSYKQSLYMDACISYAHNSTEEYKNILLSAALSTASQISNTVGNQFAQPLRPRDKNGRIKNDFVQKVKRDRSIEVIPAYLKMLQNITALPVTQHKHYSLTGDYIDILNKHGSTFSCIYADPPYTRDHYSRYYHVLETLCLRDNPEISNVKRNGVVSISRGVYRKNRHQSPFCIRSRAIEAFESLFTKVNELQIPLVLSYSPHEWGDGTHPRVVSVNQILSLAKEIFSAVDMVPINEVSHSLLNSNIHRLPARENAEILITMR